MVQIESGMTELLLHRVGWSYPLPRANQRREPIQSLNIKAERFTYFTSSRASAISDDVRRHSDSMRAILRVTVLNYTLALVAAGQVEIDVRQFASFFREEALKEQLHSHWIDGGDSQSITDSTVGRRSAALHQNFFSLAETNYVPHYEEITGKIEFFEEVQF